MDPKSPQWASRVRSRELMVYCEPWHSYIGAGRVVRNRKGFQVYVRAHPTALWETLGVGFKNEAEAMQYVEVLTRMNPNFNTNA